MVRVLVFGTLLAATFNAQAKLTPRGRDPNRVVLQLTITSPGRTDLEMDSKLILNKDFQACLRQALRENNSADFALIVDGRIAESGKLDVESLKSLSGPRFENCIRSFLDTVQFNPGPSGRFQMRLERAQSLGSPAKTLILDLSPTKIYQ